MTLMTPPSDATKLTWSALPEDAPMDRILRRRIVGENVMISEVRLAQGFTVPAHAHANEQMAVVLSGHIRFTLPEHGGRAETTMELRGGDVLVLPAHVPHGAEALEDTLILDVFSPPSEGTGVDRGQG